MKLSVIVPFLNEEENIPVLVAALNDFFVLQKDYQAEVIFVDDGSTDRSVIMLQQASHKSYACKVVSLSKNFGSHAALRAGISVSTGDVVTFLYADLQDPPELINQMLQSVKAGNHITWAVRNSTNNGFAERTFSQLYSSLMKKYVSPIYPSKGFDVVMFERRVADVLNRNIENNSSVFLQILTFGFKQNFIGYNKKERLKGKSKWTLQKKVKLFIDSFIAFSYAPIRFVTLVGIFLFLAGVLFSAYLIIRKLVYNDLNSGWPMLISVLSMGFGITNISLGIIAEYLWRTLDASRKRPVFIINEIFELKNHEQNN